MRLRALGSTVMLPMRAEPGVTLPARADLVTLVVPLFNPPRTIGTASNAGSVTGNVPGPIIPAWVGAMVVIAAAMPPMAAPKICVLINIHMALSWALSVESARCGRFFACRLAPTRNQARHAVGKIRMGRHSGHETCVPGTWKNRRSREKVVGLRYQEIARRKQA